LISSRIKWALFPLILLPMPNLSHLIKGIDEIGKVVIGLPEKKELKIK